MGMMWVYVPSYCVSQVSSHSEVQAKTKLCPMGFKNIQSGHQLLSGHRSARLKFYGCHQETKLGEDVQLKASFMSFLDLQNNWRINLISKTEKSLPLTQTIHLSINFLAADLSPGACGSWLSKLAQTSFSPDIPDQMVYVIPGVCVRSVSSWTYTKKIEWEAFSSDARATSPGSFQHERLIFLWHRGVWGLRWKGESVK